MCFPCGSCSTGTTSSSTRVRPPYAFLKAEGRAELMDDLDESLRVATLIGARYMGAERAEEFGRRNAVPGELLVRFRPELIFGQLGVAN